MAWLRNPDYLQFGRRLERSGPWFSVYAYCAHASGPGSVVARHSTFETAGNVPYTGMSDIGAIDINSYGNMPMYVSDSVFKDFPQGLDPGQGSIIQDNEIYTRDLKCWLDAAAGTTATCHGDGLFSQGGNDITYEGNYIVTPPDATSAIFYQSSPHSTGNRVIGNFIEGGSFTLYNEDSNGLAVETILSGLHISRRCALFRFMGYMEWQR